LKIRVVGTRVDTTGRQQFKFAQRKKVLCAENKQLQKDLSLHYKMQKKYRFIQSLSPGIRAGFLIFNLVFMRYSCAALNDATMWV